MCPPDTDVEVLVGMLCRDLGDLSFVVPLLVHCTPLMGTHIEIGVKAAVNQQERTSRHIRICVRVCTCMYIVFKGPCVYTYNYGKVIHAGVCATPC